MGKYQKIKIIFSIEKNKNLFFCFYKMSFSLKTCSSTEFTDRAAYYDFLRSKIVEVLTKKNVVENCLINHHLFAHHLSKKIEELNDDDFSHLVADIQDHTLTLLNIIHQYNKSIIQDREALNSGPCADIAIKTEEGERIVNRSVILHDLNLSQKYERNEKPLDLKGASTKFVLYDSFSNRIRREAELKAKGQASSSQVPAEPKD